VTAGWLSPALGGTGANVVYDGLFNDFIKNISRPYQ
jgi:hypothetical protein